MQYRSLHSFPLCPCIMTPVTRRSGDPGASCHLASRQMARRLRVSACGYGDGEADAEDVDDHANNHHLEGKGIFCGEGKRHDDAIHEEVDAHSVDSAGNDRVLYKERYATARGKVDCSRRKRDDEVVDEPE